MSCKIPIAKPCFNIEEEKAVREVLKSGILASGPKTKKFEKEYAEYIGVKHAIAVTNGTVALDVALKTINIGPGDEVITSAFSFVASGNCILFQKAKPVFADVDPKTFNIESSDVAEKVTRKTKAIIPIHLFGQPANMDALKEISEDYNIALVEDAAQAHGAEYKGKKVGSIGDVACFSFYATKNMTTGEGGMITTNDDKLANKARLLINHGQSKKYIHKLLGYNYRMNEICAALGSIQLKKLDNFNSKRIENKNSLSEEISKVNGLIVPFEDSYVKHVFHQYVIKVEASHFKSRDQLFDFLIGKGIGVAIHYPMPIYKQPAYSQLGFEFAECPETELICSKVLSLPVHPLIDKFAITYILDAIKHNNLNI
jgi:perosamine synthetase